MRDKRYAIGDVVWQVYYSSQWEYEFQGKWHTVKPSCELRQYKVTRIAKCRRTASEIEMDRWISLKGFSTLTANNGSKMVHATQEMGTVRLPPSKVSWFEDNKPDTYRASVLGAYAAALKDARDYSSECIPMIKRSRTRWKNKHSVGVQ